MLMFFLVTAILGGSTSSRLRRQAELARRNENRTEELYKERAEIELAIEREKMKSLLLRSISHDIRTLLTGISGASGTILENYEALDDESIKALIQDIQMEAQELNVTVQNILDMTRISEGKLSLHKEFEAVDDLAAQATAKVPFLTRDNRLTVQLPDRILTVEVDGRLFVQALFNLLDNAYKHSGKDAQITLRISPDGEWLAFQVSDNGAGVDPTIMDNLFEGFITSPQGTSDKGRGVGLGLSICEAIAAAHGGSVTAENAPEGGACFTIRIPYVEEAQDGI
jgi:two-component system sensor histidine kinase KdpD